MRMRHHPQQPWREQKCGIRRINDLTSPRASCLLSFCHPPSSGLVPLLRPEVVGIFED